MLFWARYEKEKLLLYIHIIIHKSFETVQNDTIIIHHEVIISWGFLLQKWCLNALLDLLLRLSSSLVRKDGWKVIYLQASPTHVRNISIKIYFPPHLQTIYRILYTVLGVATRLYEHYTSSCLTLQHKDRAVRHFGWICLLRCSHCTANINKTTDALAVKNNSSFKSLL